MQETGYEEDCVSNAYERVLVAVCLLNVRCRFW